MTCVTSSIKHMEGALQIFNKNHDCPPHPAGSEEEVFPFPPQREQHKKPTAASANAKDSQPMKHACTQTEAMADNRQGVWGRRKSQKQLLEQLQELERVRSQPQSKRGGTLSSPGLCHSPPTYLVGQGLSSAVKLNNSGAVVPYPGAFQTFMSCNSHQLQTLATL